MRRDEFRANSLHAAVLAAAIWAWNGPFCWLLGDILQSLWQKSLGLLAEHPFQTILLGTLIWFPLILLYTHLIMVPLAHLFRNSFSNRSSPYIFAQMYGFHLAILGGISYLFFRDHFFHPTFQTFFWGVILNLHLALWTFIRKLRHNYHHTITPTL